MRKEFEIPKDNYIFNYLFEYHFNGLMSTFALWIRNGKDIPIEILLRQTRNISKNAYDNYKKFVENNEKKS